MGLYFIACTLHISFHPFYLHLYVLLLHTLLIFTIYLHTEQKVYFQLAIQAVHSKSSCRRAEEQIEVEKCVLKSLDYEDSTHISPLYRIIIPVHVPFTH